MRVEIAVNDIIFAREFKFYEIRFSRYRYNDARGGAPYHYIAYMRDGTGKLAGADRTIEVAAGDFFYIPDGYPYQSYWKGQDAIVFDSYGFRHFPRPDGQIYPMQKIRSDGQSMALLERLAADKRISCTSIGLFYQRLGCLMERMLVGPESRKYMIVDAAEDYMYEHIGYTAADVARHCGVSESTLYAAFREARAYTPTQARHRLLSEKAVRLLTTTDMSVEAISEQLGFSSSIYFRKILAEQTGKTPRMIRKEREF